MTAPDIAAIAPDQRRLWTWTVLAVAESDANRSAFIDGYNGQPCPSPRTVTKREWHSRGEQVRAHLLETTHV